MGFLVRDSKAQLRHRSCYLGLFSSVHDVCQLQKLASPGAHALCFPLKVISDCPYSLHGRPASIFIGVRLHYVNVFHVGRCLHSSRHAGKVPIVLVHLRLKLSPRLNNATLIKSTPLRLHRRFRFPSQLLGSTIVLDANAFERRRPGFPWTQLKLTGRNLSLLRFS